MKPYVIPEMEIIRFEVEEIITNSGPELPEQPITLGS